MFCSAKPTGQGRIMRIIPMLSGLWAAAMVTFSGFAALAQERLEGLEVIGKPVSGGLNFQPASTSIMKDLVWLDGMLLWVCIAVSIFVTLLILTVILRHNRKANPVPSTFTHNSTIEIAWTLVPIVILVVIGAFSLPVLFNSQEIPEADVTIKVTGSQWYWTYEYVDN